MAKKKQPRKNVKKVKKEEVRVPHHDLATQVAREGSPKQV